MFSFHQHLPETPTLNTPIYATSRRTGLQEKKSQLIDHDGLVGSNIIL